MKMGLTELHKQSPTGKYVYVVFDPLYENVLCVHNTPHTTCKKCKKIREENRDAYQICVEKFMVKP